MDHRAEVRDFLTTRRARITPELAGLPAYGGTRRVPGLRRGEVAALAGVSIEYYTRLERGNLAGVSEEVLEAIAAALHLDEAEHAHLLNLARTASTGSRPRRRPAPKHLVRPGVRLALEAITGAPAYVGNGRLDILATNPLARALFAPLYDTAARPANHARFIFLDDRARDFYHDWERVAGDTVAILHTAAGRDPHDRALSDLIGELSTRSLEFRTRWAAHNVRAHSTGIKHFHHPVVGELRLLFEAMEISADTGLSLYVYSPEPGTPAEDAIKLLASWAATHPQPADTTRATGAV
ncbi:helix-turn-helix transcriptional regulator [Kocuria rosea]|uniref:helix-turn-helix transcriptional regulator n=1 Tax=Kocuria rosea TaxID=1275 RepID=UPI002541A280|nr:helix-turn-helix transcriptional regulator [Kocuria rosea]WIG19153.1 helix-turn-helix transcriptional regulator [Kocuria rosea]